MWKIGAAKIIVARKGGHELGTICKFLFSSIHTFISPILVNSLFAKIYKERSSQMVEFHLFLPPPFFFLRVGINSKVFFTYLDIYILCIR